MNLVQHALLKIAKEASDLSSEALKAAQFGMDSYDPRDNIAGSNWQRIQRERWELRAAFLLLEIASNFRYVETNNSAYTMQKFDDMRKFRDHSIELGLVKRVEGEES